MSLLSSDALAAYLQVSNSNLDDNDIFSPAESSITAVSRPIPTSYIEDSTSISHNTPIMSSLVHAGIKRGLPISEHRPINKKQKLDNNNIYQIGPERKMCNVKPVPAARPSGDAPRVPGSKEILFPVDEKLSDDTLIVGIRGDRILLRPRGKDGRSARPHFFVPTLLPEAAWKKYTQGWIPLSFRTCLILNDLAVVSWWIRSDDRVNEWIIQTIQAPLSLSQSKAILTNKDICCQQILPLYKDK